MKSISSTLLVLGLCIAATPALRATATFDTITYSAVAPPGSPNTAVGPSIANTGAGGTWSVTPYAFSINSASAAFATAYLGSYASHGLGVCDAAEAVSPGCNQSPDHAIDNAAPGGYDFVLLEFSVPLQSVQITLDPFYNGVTGHDMDATVYAGNCAGTASFCSSLASSSLTTTTMSTLFGTGKLGAAQQLTVGTGSQLQTSDVTYTISTTGVSGGVNWLLIGASVPNTDGTPDYFKLFSVTGSTTPEPATFVLAGSALLGIGLLRRKKLFSSQS